MIHGTRDSVIPFRQGQCLAQANPHARLVTFFTDHNDLHGKVSQDIEDEFWNQVRATLVAAQVIDGAKR